MNTARPAASASDRPVPPPAEESETFRIASDAYIFGYPLVTMEMTRRIITNVVTPERARGPMGTLINLRTYPDETSRTVSAPNADTLYTMAFFDVADEPWVLTQPDMGDRYFLLPMLDGWMDVFQSPGSRTTGGKAGIFLITGPGWTGTVPEGMTQLKSPTGLVWLLGRIYCTGTPEDYAVVHALQDAFRLQPLHTWGTDYAPPEGRVDTSVDMKTPARDQVTAMPARAYFTLLAQLMKRNPPTAADAPALERFARIGLVPGKDFDPHGIDAQWDQTLPAYALKRIMMHFADPTRGMKHQNGWNYTTKTGQYGTNYLQRALITKIGPGANLPQDTIYPISLRSGRNADYDGRARYTMTFPKGLLPPVQGFWSLTMYDEGLFFVANPINRYSMSVRTNPVYEPDGSLVINIQHDSPGPARQANWLPAPAGKFHLMLRLYWPDETPPSILDGSWIIPEVVMA